MMRGLGYGYNMMDGGWIGGLVMLFFGLLVLAGIVLMVVWAIRAASGQGHQGAGPVPPGTAHDDAVAIVRRRFASGEITKEQYDELMRGLVG